jgi:hypothetical protein
MKTKNPMTPTRIIKKKKYYRFSMRIL